MARTNWSNGETVDATVMNSLGTDINAKSPTASPTFTGIATTPAVKITGGSPASGKVLTSDADGDGSWTALAYDLSIVAFGAVSVRALGTGDFPFGIKLQRACTLTSVTYRCITAASSGNLVVELRKNGVAVSGSAATIATGSQVTGGTATGTWAFAAGDILTVQVTAVGSNPGLGLIADITGTAP